MNTTIRVTKTVKDELSYLTKNTGLSYSGVLGMLTDYLVEEVHPIDRADNLKRRSTVRKTEHISLNRATLADVLHAIPHFFGTDAGLSASDGIDRLLNYYSQRPVHYRARH